MELKEIIKSHSYTDIVDVIEEHLLNEDETLVRFHIANEYVFRHCIIPKDFKPGDDFLACLEMTLHRLKEAELDDTLICSFMGAVPEAEIDQDFNPKNEWITIDLNYALPCGVGMIEMPEYEEVA